MSDINIDLAILAARGAASDYLGGYTGPEMQCELQAFRHGMGTIVRVLERLRDNPDDSQTRACVEMGRGPSVLGEVAAERERQNGKWGEQNHPDGTGGSVGQVPASYAATYQRQITDSRLRRGKATFWDILLEEVLEANAETDPRRLRAELVQVAAVAVQWIEAIDRRASAKSEDDR